jgi:hypothetical protein
MRDVAFHVVETAEMGIGPLLNISGNGFSQ